MRNQGPAQPGDNFQSRAPGPLSDPGELNGIITVLQQIVNGLADSTSAINALTVQLATQQGYVTPPAVTGSPGVAGQQAYDANYFYIAVGANDWGRILLDKAF